jgi:3-oxosteroid 1-dehydrogenase
VKLVVYGGAVVGAVVTQNGRNVQIRAKHGVLLAAGGFAKSKEMRAKYGPEAVSTDWTSMAPGDTGDAVRAGIDIGAATALMGDAWWGPTIEDPVDGKLFFCLWERSRPHIICVHASGKPFFNESQCYVESGHAQIKRNESVKAIPAWMVMVCKYRNDIP